MAFISAYIKWYIDYTWYEAYYKHRKNETKGKMVRGMSLGQSNAKAAAQAAGRRRKTREGFFLFLLAFPFIAMSFVFTYLPLHGWIYAFFNFRPGNTLAQSDFVGFYFFIHLFQNPIRVQQFLQVMRNTFAMSGLTILFSWFPVAFAILLSEVRFSGVKKSIQVLTTLPHYISWVLVFAMAFAMLSHDGMVNNLLMSLGLIEAPIHFLRQGGPQVWGIMTAWGVWKSFGFGAIIYLAAITGIDQELYEAARVDGAGRFRLIWHITVPGILPTYTVLLLLAIANFLNNGFEQFFLFSNAFNTRHIEVLDLYVYNLSFGGRAFSLATAISMMRSVISVIMLFSINALSKVLRGGESII